MMFQLNHGEEARLRNQACVTNLDWTLPDNLDLVALCKSQDGAVLIHEGDEGTRIVWPYCHLAHRSFAKGRVKFRREHMVMTNVMASSEIYILVWDQDAVVEGRAADFCRHPQDLKISITDTGNAEYLFTGNAFNGNCLLVGSIQGDTVSACWRGGFMHRAEVRTVEDWVNEC